MFEIGQNEYEQMAVTVLVMTVFMCLMKIGAVIIDYIFDKLYPQDDE